MRSNKSSNRRRNTKLDGEVQNNPQVLVAQGFAGIWRHEWVHLKISFDVLVRMRSPVQIWVAAPLKPVVPQGIAGFCFIEKSRCRSRLTTI